MKNHLTTENDRRGRRDLPANVPAQDEFKNFLHHIWNMVDFPAHHEMHNMEPKIEVSETDNEVDVLAELPGVSENDIDLIISTDGYLTISGERRNENEKQTKNSYFSEMTYGMVSRTIPLPWDLDYEKTSAEYEDGVLHVSIPKSASAKDKTKKINVKRGKRHNNNQNREER